MIKRFLDLSRYTENILLLGPRQTGKTHLLKTTLSAHIYLDLLKQSEFLRYTKDISLLRKEILALGQSDFKVVVDEIQRIPELLNEIHSLIESYPQAQFFLSGSSARKLRGKGVNLLGGRAITRRLYPLTHLELGNSFDLEQVLQFGSLPKIILEQNMERRVRFLQAYVETYLQEEIQQEALTRNIPAFARFLELASFENGNLLNFSNLSREVGVVSKTIREYFQILEDTLLGFFLQPYARSHRERLVQHPKFYFFDGGVVRALRKTLLSPLIPGSPPYGHAFEHWVILETLRLLDYREREYRRSFYRTSDGAEVDLILEFASETWAIEIKSSSQPRLSELKGLKHFLKDHPHARAICVCQSPRKYLEGRIEVMPWKLFFTEL